MKVQLQCLSLLLIAGCVSTEVMAPQGTAAEFAMDLESKSPGGGMGQHWHVWKYQDSTCQAKEKAVRVARKRKGKPMEVLHLPAEQPITLAFWYIEANFGANRECSYTWTFTPKAGEKYRARLSVSPDVHCRAIINDSSDALVETENPMNSCVIGLYGQRIPNGEPATITYRVQFQSY